VDEEGRLISCGNEMFIKSISSSCERIGEIYMTDKLQRTVTMELYSVLKRALDA